MMDNYEDRIIGKYVVEDHNKPKMVSKLVTDNPLEAVWEANRRPNRVIVNVCGEKQFYKDENGKYKIIKP